jgi:chromosomal replication initiation ATPase DnaA
MFQKDLLKDKTVLITGGGTGLGKTHLIQAIGNMVLEQNRQVQVRYIHANDYVKDVN